MSITLKEFAETWRREDTDYFDMAHEYVQKTSKERKLKDQCIDDVPWIGGVEIGSELLDVILDIDEYSVIIAVMNAVAAEMYYLGVEHGRNKSS